MSQKGFNTIFILSVLSAGLLFSSPGAQAAAPNLYFHPAKDWRVQKASTIAGESPVCVVANELNNGFILNLTGTAEGLHSMSIDFRQPAFTGKTAYDVRISVPGALESNLRAVAVNRELLDIDFTTNQPLFEAIKKENVFDLALQENNFRFYLTGLTEAFEQYQNCVDLTAPEEEQPILREAAAPEADTLEMPAFFDIETARAPAPVQEIIPEDSLESAPLIQAAKQPAAEDSVAHLLEAPEKKGKTERSIARNFQKPAAIVKTEKYVAQADFSHAPAADLKPGPFSVPATHGMIESPAEALAEDMANLAPAAGAAINAGNHQAQLENKLRILQIQNASLKKELEETQRKTEKERISISSDNWNLEQATLRYNESERQNQRLGRQLQKERASWAQERAELEAMLFDPQLTSQKQLAHLARLENRVAQAEQALKQQREAYEAKLQFLQSRP